LTAADWRRAVSTSCEEVLVTLSRALAMDPGDDHERLDDDDEAGA